MSTWLADLGIQLSDAVAGFAGGVANAVIFKRQDPWGIVASVVAGTLTAAYLGPIAPAYIGLKSSPGVSFLVGLTAMAICQGLVSAASNWKFLKSAGNAKETK